MTAIKSIEVTCPSCDKASDSFMFIDNTASLSSARMEGNTQRCPHCSNVMPVDKENMTVTLEDGSKVKGTEV